MKLARKTVVTVATALAFLTGTSGALATTALAATMSAPAATASIKWLYWDSYPTLHACNAEGDHLYLAGNILTWKCVKYTEGDYFVWKLYVVLGHPPGS